MAKTITQLPDATSVAAADELIVQQGGVTKRATRSELMSEAISSAKFVPTGTSATGNGMYLPATNSVAFSTNGTERVRINASGNIGIGTNSPQARLHVVGGGSTITDAQLHISNPSTSPFSTAIINLIANSSSRVQILGQQDDNTSGGVASIQTANSSGAITERMRIDASGNVGIGTAAPATRLHVDGTIRYTNRPAAGTITAIGFDANGDLKASSSSLRYKHNVEPYVKGLADVAQLNPVTFNYNGEDLINAGLIVEDLDELGLEEFVLRDSEGTADAIPYGNMVALLINAIKELKTRVEALEIVE